MKISKEQLAASPHLIRLLDPQLAKELLGISPKEPLPPSSGNSPANTLKDAWSSLPPETRRRLKGMEAKEHGILGNWLLKHKIPFIHAPTHRKVHDLPPGWPDFTLFRPYKLPPQLCPQTAECLFLEMKVPGGVFSWEQLQWAKILPVTIVPNALEAIRLAAAFYHINLPVLNQTQPLDFSQ